MALKINTNIQNDADGYLLDASSVKGGYVVVSGEGTNVKENLPTATVVNGTPVYDAKLKKLYRWDGTKWVEEQGGAGDYGDANVRTLLANEGNQITSGYVGDFYLDQDALYVKNDTNNEYEPVVGSWNPTAEEQAAGITYGHIFNDIENTAYIAGDLNTPIYITKDTEGNVKTYKIALEDQVPNKIKYREAVIAGNIGNKIVVDGEASLNKLYIDLDNAATILPKLDAIQYNSALNNGTTVLNIEGNTVYVYAIQSDVSENDWNRGLVFVKDFSGINASDYPGAKGPALYMVNYADQSELDASVEIFIPLSNEGAPAWQLGTAYRLNSDRDLSILKEGGILELNFVNVTTNSSIVPPDCIGESQINGVGSYNNLFVRALSANTEFTPVEAKEGGLVLTRDNQEIAGQSNLVDFKTFAGNSLVGEGDIQLKTINNKSLIGEGNINTGTYQLDINITKSPDDNLSGTVTKEQFDALYADHASCINLIYPVTEGEETTTYTYCFKRDYSLTTNDSDSKFISFTCNYNLLDTVVRKYQLYIQYLDDSGTCAWSCGKVGEFEVYEAKYASRSVEKRTGSMSERDYNRYFGSVDIAGCSHIKDDNGTIYDLVHTEYTTTTPKTVLYYVYTNTSYKLKNDITSESPVADLKSTEDHNSAIFVFPADKKWLFVRDWSTAVTSYGDNDVKTLLAGYTVQNINLAESSSILAQLVGGTIGTVAPTYSLAKFDSTSGEHGQFEDVQGSISVSDLEEGEGCLVAVAAGEGNKIALAGYEARPHYIELNDETGTEEHDIMLSDDIVINAESTTPTAASTIKVKDTVYSFNATLPPAYEEYLKKATFVAPTLSFSMYDSDGNELSGGTFETGTSYTFALFNHEETSVDNIQGNTVTLYSGSTAITTDGKSATVATKSLDTPITINSTRSYKLSCTDTLGSTRSSSTITFNFVDYAYYAHSTEATAPTTVTQSVTLSTMKSSGVNFTYSAGKYLYIYTKTAGQQVQTEVLGQWADAEFTELASVTITKQNGVTDTYIPYRIGPFAKAGIAKYRVK